MLYNLNDSHYVMQGEFIIGRVFHNAAGTWSTTCMCVNSDGRVIESFASITRKTSDAAARALIKKYGGKPAYS